jgi:hypothetical protein
VAFHQSRLATVSRDAVGTRGILERAVGLLAQRTAAAAQARTLSCALHRWARGAAVTAWRRRCRTVATRGHLLSLTRRCFRRWCARARAGARTRAVALMKQAVIEGSAATAATAAETERQLRQQVAALKAEVQV